MLLVNRSVLQQTTIRISGGGRQEEPDAARLILVMWNFDLRDFRLLLVDIVDQFVEHLLGALAFRSLHSSLLGRIPIHIGVFSVERGPKVHVVGIVAQEPTVFDALILSVPVHSICVPPSDPGHAQALLKALRSMFA